MIDRRTLLAGAAAAMLAGAPAAARRRPRTILLIVGDDLAFSDIGAFGGEIPTPGLDALARRGLRLDRFTTAPTCSPSRAMLLTGTDAHRAGLGTMAELVTPAQLGSPAYRGTLRPDTATVAELLQAAGWHTILSGKWHLGAAPEEDPARRGFTDSFALIEAAHNHFGTDAGKGATYRENGRAVEALPGDFYSSTAFATRLIRGIRAAPAGADMFAMLAFTAPHWPLMAPEAAIARFRSRYDAGWDVLRRARIARQRDLGLVPAPAAAAPMELPPGLDWNGLAPARRADAARRMEVHAAMVAILDAEVGRVLAELDRSGRAEDAIIFFMSDNGAEAMDLEMAAARFARGPAQGGGQPSRYGRAVADADNRIDNLGSATSFAAYGPAWAQAGNGLLRLWKAFPTEGGSRVPALLSAPGVRAGSTSAALDVRDVLPTLLDLAGVPLPEGRFAGREVQTVSGRSWAPLLSGRVAAIRSDQDVLPHELFGARALRQGDWKLVDTGEGRWQLYDIVRDPGETDDRAAAEPARAGAMAARWDAWAAQAGVILPERPIPILFRPGAMPPPGGHPHGGHG